MLTVRKFSKTAVAALVSGLVGLGAAHAAVVASYTVEVEGSLSEVDFGSAYSFDQATNAFQQVNQAVYTNPADLHVAAPWATALGATTGGLTVNIDEHGQASYAGCSGILSAMCNGNVALFDEAAQSLVASDGVSFASQLANGSFSYADDRSYNWEAGGASFYQIGYGVSVSYDIEATSISAVPLPASLAFLLGGLALMLGLRRRQA